MLPGLALGLLATTARAQPAAWPKPYELVGIAVEVADATNGVVARDQAYRDALRRAWLLLKIALEQPLVRATDKEISDMVAAILVEQERVWPHGYSGRLTVRFDPQQVAAVAGIAQPEPETPPEDEGAPQWQDNPGAAMPDMPPMLSPAENDAQVPSPAMPGQPMPRGGQAPFWFRW